MTLASHWLSLLDTSHRERLPVLREHPSQIRKTALRTRLPHIHTLVIRRVKVDDSIRLRWSRVQCQTKRCSFFAHSFRSDDSRS